MVLKIKKIHIKALRGIKDAEIELNSNSLLIYGENGTGKSSIVDAIEFFFKRNISTLKGRGINFQRHGYHTKCNLNDVRVDLTFNGNITLTRTYNSFSPVPSQFKKYFDLAQKGIFILRRGQLLSFINSTPAERFKVISGFIGVESLDKIENEIKNSVNSLKRDIDVKEKRIEQILSSISQTVGKKISDENEVLPVLNELFEKNKLPQLNSFEDAPEHSSKMFSIVKENSENLKNILILKEIQQETENINIDLYEGVEALNNKVVVLLTQNMKENMSIKKLLESGKEALEIEKLENKCPLCEQNYNKEILSSKIQKRLQLLEKTSEDFSKLKEELRPITVEIESWIGKCNHILKQIESFDEFKDNKVKLQEKIHFLVDFKKKLKLTLDLKDQIPLKGLNEELNGIEKIFESINKKSKEIISKSDITDEEKKFLELVETLAVATSKIKDIMDLNHDLKDLESQLKIANNVYNSFLDVKKSKIQSIFDSIQLDIQDFYSLLHPNEPHNNIALKISGRASAELKITSFDREDEDPRALTSEGHLDSLGLCIFLALVKKFNQDCSLVILDDIVTTVDSAHRQMICKLLFTKFKKKQFIITTHENLWYQQLIKSQQVFGVNFKNYTITNWTVDDGPDLKPYQIKLDRIYNKIDSGDLACAGNEGRQYLEWILEEICKSIDAEVLMKARYTAGDLVGPVRHQLKDIVADAEIKCQIKEAFRELDNNSIMGNILSHSNLLAGNVSPTEVRRFVKSVKKNT
ncbi:MULTISPECIES: AAA family ATPase [Methanobacterium]|uniref:AAA family ATPase n=1 Tax=Methanobacterium veterum TaxID=408577 RepID=A0A9E4ZXW0_9EURY|nr:MULTISPECIES: AAA family ATPase [Methanobacterium]MCZ3367261.1 AAA family ATPase [Methanobacterium veterum]MCZ3373591.1 AAA family ATPase [Methanobacterium veterum]